MKAQITHKKKIIKVIITFLIIGLITYGVLVLISNKIEEREYQKFVFYSCVQPCVHEVVMNYNLSWSESESELNKCNTNCEKIALK